MKHIISGVALSGLLLLAAPALAQDISIERFAPESTFVVAGSHNVTQAKERFIRTGALEMLKSEFFATMTGEAGVPALEDLQEKYEEMLVELGLDSDLDLCPTGALGLAMYTTPGEDIGTRQLGMLLLADFGENADDVNSFIEAVLDKGTEEGKLEYDEDDVLGRRVITFDLASMREQHAEDFDDEFGGDMDMMPSVDDFDDIPGFGKLHLVRDENRYFLSTNISVVTETLAHIDEGGSTPFVDREDFLGAMGQHNSPDGYGLLLTRPMFEAIGSLGGGGMELQMAQTMLPMFLGDVRAISMSTHLDTPDAMSESTFGIYMPAGKSGLSALFDAPGARGDLPDFVTPDAISYSAFHFKFNDLIGFIRTLMRQMGPMMGMPPEAVDQMQQTLQPIVDPLANRIHVVEYLRRPVTPENVTGITAIELKDAEAFENAINNLAPQVGMEPRDFLGHRIYSMDAQTMAMMMPMPMGGAPDQGFALGIAGEHLYLGLESDVEQALRMSGQQDAPSLASTPEFERALARLSGADNLIAWGFSKTVEKMEADMVLQAEQMESMIEQIREIDPEYARDMEEQQADVLRAMREFDPQEFAQYIGPTIWELQSNDAGFVARIFQLRGEQPAE